ALGRSKAARSQSSKARAPHRPRTGPTSLRPSAPNGRPEPLRRGGTRKRAVPDPGCAAPSCLPPPRIAPRKRNHARGSPSTPFCNTICTNATFVTCHQYVCLGPLSRRFREIPRQPTLTRTGLRGVENSVGKRGRTQRVKRQPTVALRRVHLAQIVAGEDCTG